MSSTGIGTGLPSLPSDHAIISRLSSNYESWSPESQPTIEVHPNNEPLQHLPTETSPLLDRPLAPVPPIEENVDYNASADKTSTVNLFREELVILTKFTIPAFGYAPSLLFFNES